MKAIEKTTPSNDTLKPRLSKCTGILKLVNSKRRKNRVDPPFLAVQGFYLIEREQACSLYCVISVPRIHWIKNCSCPVDCRLPFKTLICFLMLLVTSQFDRDLKSWMSENPLLFFPYFLLSQFATIWQEIPFSKRIIFKNILFRTLRMRKK